MNNCLLNFLVELEKSFHRTMEKAWLKIIAFIAGIFLGPSSLDAAKESDPPLDWNAILFFFVACIVGTILVIGFQIVRKDPKLGLWAINYFFLISLFMFGSGIGALASGLLEGDTGATIYLFLVIGGGSLIGVETSRILYNAKFKQVR